MTAHQWDGVPYVPASFPRGASCRIWPSPTSIPAVSLVTGGRPHQVWCGGDGRVRSGATLRGEAQGKGPQRSKLRLGQEAYGLLVSLLTPPLSVVSYVCADIWIMRQGWAGLAWCRAVGGHRTQTRRVRRHDHGGVVRVCRAAARKDLSQGLLYMTCKRFALTCAPLLSCNGMACTPGYAIIQKPHAASTPTSNPLSYDHCTA